MSELSAARARLWNWLEGSGNDGGQRTGPNPTDRSKLGSKRHVVADRNGIPLAMKHTAPNVHDSKMLEALVDAVASIHRPQNRSRKPRKLPEKLHVDKGYDARAATTRRS